MFIFIIYYTFYSLQYILTYRTLIMGHSWKRLKNKKIEVGDMRLDFTASKVIAEGDEMTERLLAAVIQVVRSGSTPHQQ
jgi:hypothetical protein